MPTRSSSAMSTHLHDSAPPEVYGPGKEGIAYKYKGQRPSCTSPRGSSPCRPGCSASGWDLSYGAITSLIVQGVPASQTGSATGLNANLRIIGGATGAAIVSSGLWRQGELAATFLRMSEPSADPKPGDVRVADNGDLQVFDGRNWTTIQSIHNDPEGAIRDDPGPGR
jgi:hypothetical protein